jgi:hypothetical protein
MKMVLEIKLPHQGGGLGLGHRNLLLTRDCTSIEFSSISSSLSLGCELTQFTGLLSDS